MQETKNYIWTQGEIINTLENQVWKIAITLSSRVGGALPSIDESFSSTFGIKNIETCKVISLQRGREYERQS